MKKEFLLVLLTVTSFVQINAQTLPRQYVITADTATKQLLDNDYWQVLQDENGKFTIDDVQHEPLANQFTNFTKNSKDNFAKTTWFRFNIKNSTGKILKLSISSDAAVTDFYVPDSNGIMHHFTTGTEIPWRKKNGFKKDNAIPFEMKPGGKY